MTPDEQIFRLLALCTQRPGNPDVAARLPAAVAAIPPGLDLVEQAEHHGLAPLLLAHLREAKVPLAPELSVRLFARHVQHAHAAVVRTRLVREAVEALTQAEIPILVLKGAALARLVYAAPTLRPMRDVDLLVRRRDARRAYEILLQSGFTPISAMTPSTHHHLPGLSKSEDGATITIELHHELLVRTPLMPRLVYDDLRPAAQTFGWDGLSLKTLGRADMLWHVYAHAFAINTLCPAVRLISVADLVHAVEAWVDDLDWDAVRRRYGRMGRALPLVDQLTPWSPHVREVLRIRRRRPVSGVHQVSSSLRWTGALNHDVLWPPEWWFRMRYGIDGPGRWLWYRFAGHPLRAIVTAAGTATRRVLQRLHPLRAHRLLNTPS